MAACGTPKPRKAPDGVVLVNTARVAISTLQPKREFEIVGIARYGDVDSLGTATFAVFDIPTAQALLDREGQVDFISVAGEQGTTPEELIRTIGPALPDDARVRSAAVEAQERAGRQQPTLFG